MYYNFYCLRHISETQELANMAARQVTVNYTDIKMPVLSIEEGIEANSFHSTGPFKPLIVGNPDSEYELQCCLP